MDKHEIESYLRNVSMILIAFLFLVFPLFFLTNMTDIFILPKQMLLIMVTSLLAILWGIRMIVEKKITLRTTPFNIPVLLFGIIVIISSLIAPNRFDSLLQAVPLFMMIILYFIVINTIQTKAQFNILLTSLMLGGLVSGLFAILYNFKIYLLPFPQISTQYFNTFGSGLQLLIYLLPLLIISSFLLIRKKNYTRVLKDYSLTIQAVSSVVIIATLVLIGFQIATTPQSLNLLPYIHGFQIAFGSISQDTPRLLLSFLFGSGYGTFLTDFTRFRSVLFNQEATLWNYTFSYSSSYVLELIATTGILGLLSYLFIIFSVIKTRLKRVTPLYIATLVSFGLSFIMPFSYVTIFLLFMLVAIYALYLYFEDDKRVYTVTLSLVALRHGLIEVQEGEKTRKESPILSILFALALFAIAGFVGFWTVRYFMADTLIVSSLSQENLQAGQKAYDLQVQGINTFKYKSDYYRVFSQLNFALANSLSSATPQGSSPSAQTQQAVLTLLQGSINNARTAAALSPMTSLNWQNLAQIYRGLINVGQNAEQFSVASMNEAIALDPTNPQLYIERGGIYYQLGQYDAAQNQFEIAVNLKPDYANSHYNLGHALESKEDLQGALQQYLVVRQLVQNNKDNLKAINAEIAAIETKIGNAQKQNAQQVSASDSNEPLEVNEPEATIRPQREPVKLPPPPTTPKESASPTPKGN